MKVKVDISLTEEDFQEKSLDICLAKIHELRHRSKIAYQNKKLFPASMNILPEHQLIFGRLFKAINPNRKLIQRYSEFTDKYLFEIKNIWEEYYSYLRSHSIPFEFKIGTYSERQIEYDIKDVLRNTAALTITTTEASKLYLQLNGNKYLRKSISKHILRLVILAEENDLNNFISEYQSQVLHYGFYSSTKKTQMNERIEKLISIN